MSKPTKRGNSWHCTVYDYTDANGKQHNKSITAPTKAECEYKASQFRLARKANKGEVEKGITVREAIDRYISLSELLSPTTLHAYKVMKEYAFQYLMSAKVHDLTDSSVQQAINAESKRISEKTGKQVSAKTVKNEWGLLASALKSVCNRTFNVRLPKQQKSVETLPSPADVMKAIQGNVYELPCLLAMWMGLRMSEIRGIECSAIRDGYLYIEKVMVDVGSDSILKSDAKTASSKRKLKIPIYILDLINDTESYQTWLKTGKNALLLPYSRDAIYHGFTRAVEKQGIKMSFHDLRHLYASISLNILGLPEKVVQVSGGWSTPIVMKGVYSQSFEELQNRAEELRADFFQNLLD